ncbi:MAG: hypothetical protein IT380_13150 [Myxococcales bacterium]|nr:hypothetical protein [Myxococcales bacterium]
MTRMTWLSLAALLSACAVQCGPEPTEYLPPSCTSDGTNQTLTLNITQGEGAVTVSPTGTACTTFGGQCTWQFPRCTPVRLTATPYSGYTKAEWTGCDSAQGLACDLELRAARSVSLALKE